MLSAESLARPALRLLRFFLPTQIWLVLCIRAASFVPLPGFAAAARRGGAANVVDLLVPHDLGDLTGAPLYSQQRPPIHSPNTLHSPYLSARPAVATAGMSVTHMGISPYITASIALSFALAAVPELRAWRKDAGAAGTDVIAQLGRRLGLAISLLQARAACAAPLRSHS